MSRILINKNNYLSHILGNKSRNFATNRKIDMFVKKYMEKIPDDFLKTKHFYKTQKTRKLREFH